MSESRRERFIRLLKSKSDLDIVEITHDGVRELIEVLEQPDRRGEWIHREDMDFLDENKVAHAHFMCSECGLIHDFLDWHTAQYNFCPNCGADMREVTDGNHN